MDLAGFVSPPGMVVRQHPHDSYRKPPYQVAGRRPEFVPPLCAVESLATRPVEARGQQIIFLLNLFSTIESGGGTRCALSFRKEKKPTFFALIRTWVHRFPSRTAKLSRLRPGQYVGERSQRNPGWREVYYDTHLFSREGWGSVFFSFRTGCSLKGVRLPAFGN